MKKFFFVYIFMFFFYNSFGISKIERGLSLINQYNFGDAYKIFVSLKDKDNIGYYYGISIINSFKGLNYYNLDSAYSKMIFVKYSFLKLNPLVKEEYNKKGISLIKIDSLLNKYSNTAYMDLNSDMVKIDNFLSNYKEAIEYNLVVQIKLKLLYEKSLESGKSEDLEQFIKSYPHFEDIEKAKIKYQDLKILEINKNENIDVYFEFIKKNLSNYRINEIIEKLYYIVLSSNEIISNLERFIIVIPNTNPFYDSAWTRLYKQFNLDSKTTTLFEFKNLYLGFPYQNILNSDIEKSLRKYLPIKKDDKWGFISYDKEYIIEPTYDWVGTFSGNVVSVGKNNQTLFINKSNNILFVKDFSDCVPLNHDYFIVTKNDYVGVIDHFGNNILPIIYDEIYSIGDSIFGYCVENKCGLMDICFNKIILPKYETIEKLNLNLIKVKNNNKWGVIRVNSNDSIEEIIPIVNNFISNFNDSLLMITNGDSYKYYDVNGTVILDLDYNIDINLLEDEYKNYNFSNGFARACKKNKCGVINKNGNKVLDFKYDDVTITRDSIVGLKYKNNWSFYNFVTKKNFGKYNYIKPFYKNIGIGREKNILDIIDKNGTIILSEIWNDVIILDYNNFLITQKDSKFGLFEINGKELLPLNYENIKLYIDNIIVMFKDKKISYYSLEKKDFIYTEE